MNLLERARLDAKTITSNKTNGFATEAVFVAPGGQTATVNVLWSEHNLSFDEDGQRVNSKNSHLTVHEDILLDASYPTRDARGNVNLANLSDNNRHKVTVEGVTYSIRECYPSKTTGLLVIILQSYNNG